MKRSATGLFVFLTIWVLRLGPAWASQIPCDGQNFSNDNVIDCTTGGPMIGITWLPTANETISRIEIFTGFSGGGTKQPNRLAIRLQLPPRGRSSAACGLMENMP